MSKPFKMKGHELPGPNQRSSAVKQTQEFSAEGYDASGNRINDPDGERQQGSGVRQAFGQMQQDIFGGSLVKANKPPDGGHRVTGEAFTGHETGDVNASMEKEKAKKSVDVEVTVNGKEV